MFIMLMVIKALVLFSIIYMSSGALFQMGSSSHWNRLTTIKRFDILCHSESTKTFAHHFTLQFCPDIQLNPSTQSAIQK